MSVMDRIRAKAYLLDPSVLSCPCVYLLCAEGRAIYIGQSARLVMRLPRHVNKAFDEILILPVAAEHLDRAEIVLIHALKPELNKTTGGRGLRVSGGCPCPFDVEGVLADIGLGDDSRHQRRLAELDAEREEVLRKIERERGE